MFIPIIIGATRPGNKGSLAGKAIEETLKEFYPEIETKVVSPLDFEIKFDGAQDSKYTEITKKADAFIFVLSEYNHAFPGKLKTLIDSEKDNYKDKPVLLAGVSIGQTGGARAISSIVEVFKYLQMFLIRNDILFSKVGEIFNEAGLLIDQNLKENIKISIDELLRVVKKLS
jgi:NAD(P)H-dependent FMN reductase